MDILSNKELRFYSREQLKGEWGRMAFVYFVYILIIYPPMFIFSEYSPIHIEALDKFLSMAVWAVTGAFALGFAGFFLKRIRNEEIAIDNIFDGFQRFTSSLALMFLMSFFTTLWMMLFIVPGIIKSISYSMSYYIMYDNPDIKPLDAIKKSQEMMKGYKWKYFKLGLSFIGWALLCLLTLGIGYLWLYPYIGLSLANFYENLKKNQEKPLPITEEMVQG